MVVGSGVVVNAVVVAVIVVVLVLVLVDVDVDACVAAAAAAAAAVAAAAAALPVVSVVDLVLSYPDLLGKPPKLGISWMLNKCYGITNI